IGRRARADRRAHADADARGTAPTDAHAADTAADARPRLRRADGLPRVPVAAVVGDGVARRRTPGAQHVFVGRPLPGTLRMLDVLHRGAGAQADRIKNQLHAPHASVQATGPATLPARPDI